MALLSRTVDRHDPNFLSDVPNILYKYRDWGNDYHRRILETGELYFATANQFNDPFDFALPYKLKKEDLTEDNIFRKYIKDLEINRPELSPSEMHKIAYEEQKKGLFHDPEHIEKVTKQFRDIEHKSIGIVSLTTENNNFLMWSHYSNSHTGFIVGFDKFALFDSTQTMFGKVDYEADIPSFGLFDEPLEKAFTLLLTKSNIWHYEEEYRLVSSNYAGASVKIPTAIREVILGCKMEHNQKLVILDLIEEKLPHIKVFETSLNKDKFVLDVMQIR